MTAEVKSRWKCRACYEKVPLNNAVNKPGSPLPQASSVNEILSTLDRSNVTLRSKQVFNLDDSTVENNVISELVLEIKALREQVALLNYRLGEAVVSVDRCHDKIDSYNNKQVGIEERILNLELTHTNQTLCHCDQNSDNSTNHPVVKAQPKRPKSKLPPPSNTTPGTSRNNPSPRVNSSIPSPVRTSTDINTATEKNLSTEKTTNNYQESRDSMISENKSSSLVIEANEDCGLGAAKVAVNFEDIEREAIMAEKLKMEAKAAESTATIETVEQEVASLRLAYKDPSNKNNDRLGIAGANKSTRAGVSHSAAADMTIIEQEGTNSPSANKHLDDIDDFNSVFTMIRNEPYGRGLDSLMGEPRKTALTSSWENIEPEQPRAVRTMFSVDEPASAPKGGGGGGAGYSGGGAGGGAGGGRKPRKQEVEDDSAVKKFGSAKAISSAQFFGEQDNSLERDANLSRFQGSTSISSADYFGERSPGGGRAQPGFTVNAPDLDEVRESVRAGVTRVAGRLSSLANGVVSSIQERYGY
ncbi:hypothetical protein O0L34_g10357 [Tuta absoluta]|nr:hypothetical protein O0L34_g10357 [Tuta absoluta]